MFGFGLGFIESFFSTEKSTTSSAESVCNFLNKLTKGLLSLISIEMNTKERIYIPTNDYKIFLIYFMNSPKLTLRF